MRTTHPLQIIKTRLNHAANLGIWQIFVYFIQIRRIKYFWNKGIIILFSRFNSDRLYCRAGTSDINVFFQIFVKHEYRCLDGIEHANLIVDCGANVGYSSAYFAGRFPDASVFAIEPDPGNYEVLQKNVQAYGPRIRTFRGGVWSRKTGLRIAETKFGDGREWARSVREVRDGESATIDAIDIGSIISDYGNRRISILKIDIEGSELSLFGGDRCSWIDMVDNIVIELHGEACRAAFFNAIKDQDFEVTRCDELTVCKRKHVRVPAFA